MLASWALALAACGGTSSSPTEEGSVATNPPAASAGRGAASAAPMGTSVMPAVPSSAAKPPAAPSGAAGTGTAANTAGTPAAMMPSVTPPTGQVPQMMPTPASGSPTKLAMDECGLHTTWDGDEYCINAPPPDKGFQVHIGPTNYDNPEAKFLMQPGTESVETFSATSGNQQDIYYYWRQYRMRPGTHHMILTSGGLNGRRIGGAQNLAYDNPVGGVIPAEDQDIGMTLAANTPLNINLHYMNFTDKPILKEVWINVWYRDAADVKQSANEMYSFAPMNVPAGQHVVLRGVCPVNGAGRILTVYGHRHANNLRFSVWRERASQKDLVYEDYHWEEPLILQYSSVEKNTAPDAVKKLSGGWNGVLDVMPGDNMAFECEIVNMSNKTFRGANEAMNDEMCILIGDTVQATVSNRCTYTTTPVSSTAGN
jgi:hypothetical protein